MLRFEETFYIRMLYNILDNAVRYSLDYEGCSIVVRLISVDDTYCVEIVCILEEESLYFNHVNLDNVENTQVNFGFGLALCHYYLGLIGGRLSFNISPADWSAFRMHFPKSYCLESSFNTTSTYSVSESDHLLSSRLITDLSESMKDDDIAKSCCFYSEDRKVVFVVDDNESVRLLCGLYLQGTYEVKLFSSGVELLAYYEAQGSDVLDCPDLILMDIDMPILNGFETLTRLRRITPNVSVFSISGVTDIETLNLVDAKFCGHIAKPFDRNDLREKVKNALVGC
jgi:CheY-like chemotaxis protein